MCGIAGLIGNHTQEDAVTAVAAMLRAVGHRGPDGEGISTWDGAVLGHRRLAIFDLSDLGRQPMLSPSGHVGIVFNGAIYNFRELRVQLEDRGYGFKSQTDTEVLIHGYDAWGIDELVDRLRGMFAFALWDQRARKLFLVRDRLGVKPLLYAQQNGSIAFASTVRALRLAGFVGEIDEQALTEYLEFGFVTDNRVIYEGAQKVRAGTIVEWSPSSISSRKYWTAPEVQTQYTSISFEEAVEETERLFLQAVEKRLFADVPVGALLSGGVDSSLICWAIAKLGGDITAFTVGTSEDPEDETATATATAARLGIPHKVLNVSSSESPDPAMLAAAFAEPFACSSALGMLRVSEAVVSEATVLLTGDGGDDVFLGYPEHRNFYLAQKLAQSIPTLATQVWLRTRKHLPRLGPLKRMSSLFDYASGGLGAIACAHDGLPTYRAQNLLGARLKEARVEQRAIGWSQSSARNLLAEFLRYDQETRFVGEYMTKVDGATMHYALEARSPFLDQDLWEFASQLPFERRLQGNQLKAILRKLAAMRVGEGVARGPKRGFTIPVQRWLAGRWRSRLTEVLHESLLAKSDWINNKAALKLLDESASRGWVPLQLWYILVLELWLRHERLPDSGPATSRVNTFGLEAPDRIAPPVPQPTL